MENGKILKKYSSEINSICHILKQLEEGRIYEFTQHKQDGYLSTNIQSLRKELNSLLNKIANGSNSAQDELDEALKNFDL